MREILFRGKCVDNGEWVYGSYYHCCGTAYGATFIVVNDFGFIEVIPHTVGQYTGLTDKNGKKIFEGDIIKKENQGKSVLEFGKADIDCCGCCYKYHTIVGFYRKWVGTDYVSADEEDYDDVEVIGNIYDNKDLLKED